MSGIINSSSTIDYDNLYQHDELGASGWVYYNDSDKIYGANIFKKSNKVELLKEVSINIGQEEYVKVYVNPKNSSKSIENLIEVSGYELMKPGYHTIKLSNALEIKGKQFVVAAKYIAKDGIADENITEITEWKAETKIGKMCTMLLNPDDNDPKQPNEDEKKPNSDVHGEYYPGANMGGALTGDTTNIMMYMGMGFMSLGQIFLLLFKRNKHEE